MKCHFVQRFFALLVILLAGSVDPLTAGTIRCADPKCPICLAQPDMTAPKNFDSREPRNRPEDVAFGRPASLAVVNPLFRSPLDVELKKLVHRRHPGALAIHNDGGVNTPENSDFDTPNSYCWPFHPLPSILPWKPGSFDYVKMPFVAHEYMNLGLSLDGKERLRFKANVATTSDQVEAGDTVLEYRRMAFMGNESTGVMALTVPRKGLTPGKTVQLRLSCDNLGFGDSWVGILEK